MDTFATPCVLRPTKDPRAFGPRVWAAMHILAENYPRCPSESKRRRCRRYLFAISHMLPCGACGRHFRQYLRSHAVERAVCSREGLVKLLVGAHNSVSSHTRPSRAPFTVEEARALYSEAPVTRPLAGVWGAEPSATASPSALSRAALRSSFFQGRKRWRDA